jgi:hypothetical protein
MKTTQIETTAGPWPLWRRCWHGLVPCDVRSARRVKPALDNKMLWNILLHLAVLGAAFAGLARLGSVPESGRAFARAVFGAAFVYAFMETLSDAIRLIHRMVGIEVSPIQDAPILARSLGEFWSERWNRPVSVWLRETAFLPLARLRYPTLGLVAAFCLSAGIHAYFYAVPLGGQAALMVAAFFVVQAVMIVAEKRLRVRAWPAPAARAWTLILLLACSPLFVEPILSGAGLR